MLEHALYYLSIPLVSVFCGLISFVLNRKHLLCVLLSLEFTMLSIFWILCLFSAGLITESYILLFFLVLVACEGALGLSVLVSVVRMHGNDCFSTFSSLQC